MFTTLLQTLTAFVSTLAGFGAPSEVDDVTHLLEEAIVAEKPILHTGPSPFAQWVDELDDEVTETISGRRFNQLLLHAEHKAARKAQRRHAASQMVNLNARYSLSA